MSEVQKEILWAPNNLGALVAQYKQIEQAFNTRITELVKGVLPKDFDMSIANWFDRVFQELHSPQNLRKEGVVRLELNTYSQEEVKKIYSNLSNAFNGAIYDGWVVTNISKMETSVTIYFSILPENLKTDTLATTVSNISTSVDWILGKSA